MKNLFFYLCFLCLSAAGYGQSARIEFLPEDNQRVLYQRQCLVMKANEPYELTFSDAKMYGESFIIAFKMVDFFLEPNDHLKVKIKGQSFEIVDDGSICAAQNKLLYDLCALRREYNYYKTTVARMAENAKPWTVDQVCDSMTLLFKQFKKHHSKYSKNFEKVIETELKYYRILMNDCPPSEVLMFGDVPEEVLGRISEVIEDSKDERVMYSTSYWNTAKLYSRYLRLTDPLKLLGDPYRYYENEIKLANYFKSKGVRERMLFENLEGIMFWASPKDKEQIDKCISLLTPGHKDKILVLWADLEKDFKERKTDMVNTFPRLSGENVKGEVIDMEKYRGSWILLDIWATWCVPCCGEIPYVSAMEKRFEGKNVVFLSLSVNEAKEREKWINKIQENQMSGLQLRWLQTRDELYGQFGMTGIPHFAIIDPQGRLVLNRLPNISTGVVCRILNKLLE